MLIVLACLFWFGYRPPMGGASLFGDPWANLQIVIGPAVVLGLGQAPISRAWRAPACSRWSARITCAPPAQGPPGTHVISLHALPNALLPVITLSGILVGFVLAGSIPVERAFAVPGLGFRRCISRSMSATCS